MSSSQIRRKATKVIIIKTVLRDPPADKSHVVIESDGAFFRVSGKQVSDQSSEEMPTSTWRNYIDALDAAKAWAEKREIRQVFVVGSAVS